MLVDRDPTPLFPDRPSRSDNVGDRGAAANGLWGSDGFGFDDLLDIVNPLQHIPFVSGFYRQVTGDELGFAPRLMGGGLFGGLIGAGIALVDGSIHQVTGRDTAEHSFDAMTTAWNGMTGAFSSESPGDTATPSVRLAEQGSDGGIEIASVSGPENIGLRRDRSMETQLLASRAYRSRMIG
ncbi:MAG: hypothetical protein ACFB6S_03135 [Geminicoccaceae bacterium]